MAKKKPNRRMTKASDGCDFDLPLMLVKFDELADAINDVQNDVADLAMQVGQQNARIDELILVLTTK